MFNRNSGGSRGGFGGDRRSSGGFGGGRDGGSRGGFGGGRGGDRERPQMHSAICAECGDSCQVPFKPSGERPVLCSTCFGGKDSAPKQSFSRDKDFSRDSSRDFSRNESRDERRSEHHSDGKEQLEALNVKLDRLIKLVEKLTPTASVAKVSVPKISAPEAEEMELESFFDEVIVPVEKAEKVKKAPAKKKIAKK